MQDFALGKATAIARTKPKRLLLSTQLTKTLRIIKLTAVFILLACLQVSASGFGQEKITLSVNNAPLKEVFQLIKKQTGYTFIYQTEWLKDAKKITANIINASIGEAMDICLKGQNLSYTVVDRIIVIKPATKIEKAAVTIEIIQNTSSPIDIRGRVINENGEPVLASISVKGTTRGTTTNDKGEFLLQEIEENTILVITGVNIEATEIKIGGQKNLVIKVKSSVAPLDETIVKGYYTTTRRLNTGSVTKVNSESLSRQPVANFLQALEGYVAGLQIVQSTGVAGGGFTVRLRGQNSIASGNDPLFIIDGVPFSSFPLGSEFSGGIILGGSPLNNLNIADIESVEVLKDADATAIYGSRGANGVILITTKKGKAGKTNVQLAAYTGIGRVTRKMDLLNTQQYLDMRNEAFKNDNSAPQLANAPDLLIWDTTQYTDWQKKLTGGDSHISDAHLSISGGNLNTQFFLESGYRRETAVFPGDFSDNRASIHFNLNHISDNRKFKATFSTTYLIDFNNLPRLDLTTYALSLAPNAPPVFDSAKKLNWVSGFSNPYGVLSQKYQGNTDNLISNLVLGYEILPHLQFKSSFGYTKMEMDEMIIYPQSSFSPNSPTKAFSQFANRSIITWIIEPQLNFERRMNWGSFEILIGSTLQQSLGQATALVGNGFSSDALLENLAAASSITVRNREYNKYRYQAAFCRLSYDWKDKYLFNLTGRRDGSSRFGPDRRFANFGAAGVGWIFSNEGGIHKALSFLSYGKIRGSYGITGNDQIGDYGYLDVYSSTSYPYQNVGGLSPVQLFNSDYSWENNKKLELGLEIGFFKDRLLFSANYYRNRSSNQLVGYPLPYITGFGSIKNNLSATVQNSGLELDLKTSVLKKPDFNWIISANVSVPKNKLISYPNLESSSYANVYQVGEPLTIKKGFHFIGVNTQKGIYNFLDADSNGTVSYPKDLSTIKKVGPSLYGGVENSMRYKNIELSFFVQLVKQMGRSYLSGFPVPGSLSNQPMSVLNRWQKIGDNSPVQKFTQGYGPAYSAYFNTQYYGDNLVVDASFIRLKNVSISYTFSDRLTKRLKTQNIRIYAQAQNLLTKTRYVGLDPENQSFAALPPLKVVIFGFSITF